MNDTEAATSERSWPVLRASDPDPCDGVHPTSRETCVLGHHSGYHRSASGVEWLDD